MNEVRGWMNEVRSDGWVKDVKEGVRNFGSVCTASTSEYQHPYITEYKDANMQADRKRDKGK